MAPKTRLKAKAQINVPQNNGECAADIKQIGDLQRQLARTQAEMNDAIAHVTQSYQGTLEALTLQIGGLQEGVQAYCEANRNDLTNGGKVKTSNFITGEVQWRQRPPSVRVTGADSVIETLQRLGLSAFVREKLEVNKEAILNEPEKVKGVAGINIITGVEDFVITPFEQEVVA
ncbi:MAG: host-nuclease inhibitor Gam family protein [Pseudomonadota bacterium]